MLASPAPAPSTPPRVLVVAPDVVGRKMAGPGMRSVAIAQTLASSMPLTLALGIAGSETVDLGPGITVVRYTDRDELETLVDECDVLFGQFLDTNVVDYAIAGGKRVVYDLYNALPIETVGAERVSGFTETTDKDREFAELLRYFRYVAGTGSYFVTSNERQRDWWLGFIMSAGGVIPSTLRGRRAEEIIGLAPFGMNEVDPVRRSHGLRGRHGITDDDFVVIWAGGIWDWFDAETPIRAVAALTTDLPRLKLVFYGTSHPNKVVGTPVAVSRAKAIAAELGVLGSAVVFLDDWVPADERADYLLDADAALSSHRESLETRFAFRTRILDHFWARLPSIVTSGDWFATYIDRHGLGIVTACDDLVAMTNALRRMHDTPAERASMIEAIDHIREDWRWSSTVAPLRDTLLGWRSTLVAVPPHAPMQSSLTSPAPRRPTIVRWLRRGAARVGLGRLRDRLRAG